MEMRDCLSMRGRYISIRKRFKGPCNISGKGEEVS